MSHLSRRAFLTYASALPFALRTAPLWSQSPGEESVAHTPLGDLRGEIVSDVRMFRGVPYAQPPVGPLRFQPPQKVAPWTGTRPAMQFAPAAMQPTRSHLPCSEDCLYLNIWAPKQAGTYPVFVYIHGGGYTAGRASDPGVDGSVFARDGIVYVTVAYRLGVFGFLDLAPLLGGQYAGSANNAVRDLVCALEWVQANIASFGGDPGQVTIGGESAGAKFTDTLMGVPSAQKLFHGMISESGGAERIWPQPNAAEVADGFGRVWTVAHHGPAQSLLTAEAAQLIEAQQKFTKKWPRNYPLRPEIDGSLIPRLPVETIAAGSTRGKRLLIGTNHDESSLFIGPHPSHDAAAKDLGNLPVARFASVYERYKEIYPDRTKAQRRILALTAEEYWVPSIRVAEAHVQGGGNAWMYRLDFSETSGKLKGYAYHSLDVALAWDHPHRKAANITAEAQLASQVHRAWVAFIKGQPPAAPGLPEWPQYTTASRETMLLNTQSTVEENPHAQELALWNGVL